MEEEKLLRLVQKAESHEYPTGVSFSEEADNYGFSWTPSIETLKSSQISPNDGRDDKISANSQTKHEERNQEDYLSLLLNDPVFHNPGSHQLMSESYGLDPYFSFQYGSSQQTWNYKSIQQNRNHHISNQLTINGIDLCRKGKYEEALRALKQATELNEMNVDALVALGACNANIGNLTDAVSHLQTALSLNPNDRNAQSYLDKTKEKLELRNIPLVPSHQQSDDLRINSEEEIEDKRKKSPKDKKKKRKSSEAEEERKSRKKEKKHKKEKRMSSKSRSPSSSTKNSPVETQLHPILSRPKNSLWG
jgi:tetratricopeptide (TPR) repeat protein